MTITAPNVLTSIGNVSLLSGTAAAAAVNSNDSAASLFKTALNGVLSEKALDFESLAAAEYPTLCGDEVSAVDEAESAEEDVSETEDGDTELITSCFECPVKHKCEHHIKGGNDILADNGWAIKVNKRGFHLNKEVQPPQTAFVKPADRTVIYDFTNIYFPAEFKKRRVN